MKKHCFTFTERSGLEQHKVGLGRRQILLPRVRCVAASQLEAKAQCADEDAQCRPIHPLSKCRHHMNEKENTGEKGGLPEAEMTTPTFTSTKVGVIEAEALLTAQYREECRRWLSSIASSVV